MLYDLLVEFFEDHYDESPKEMREIFVNDDGDYTFDSSGDELIDKWEKELEMGLTPDLEEGLSKDDKDRLKTERTRKTRGINPIDSLFSKPENKRYQSKSVVRGSEEDKLLGSGKSKDGWIDLLGDD